MILSVFLVDLFVNLPNGRKMEQLFYLVNQTRVGNKRGKGKTNLIYAVGVKIAHLILSLNVFCARISRILIRIKH